MTDDKRETAERPKITKSEADSNSETGRFSHDEEARGYIAGFLEFDYLDDLAAVLQAAEQLTSRRWSVVITADGAEIEALGPVEPEESEDASGDDGEDEEVIELKDLAESSAEELEELEEDSFSDFEDAFDYEDD